jgi:hypothetical protein
MSQQRLPLGRFTAEGVVIVLSILLAFGVDAWWDSVQESARRSDLIAGLSADFEATQEQLGPAALDGDAIVQRISEFLALRGSSQLPSLDSTQFLAHALALPPPEVALSLGNHDAAVQSGDLGLIDDVEFFSALAEFQRAHDWVEDTWDLLAYNFFQGPIKDLRDRVGSLSPVISPAGADCVTSLYHPAQGVIYCAPYPEDWALSAAEIVSLLDDRTLYSGFETTGNLFVNYVFGLRMMHDAAANVSAALAAMR